jgi:hypothetical protein
MNQGTIVYTGRMPMTENEKVRENRLRRAAERQGLKLEKSRVRDPRALTYGGWRLVAEQGGIVYGDEAKASRGSYGLSLDQVEEYLLGDRDEQRGKE